MSRSSRPFTVALTGGIGAGKSTAAALFAELGVEVIDADIVAREVVAPGTELLAAVVAAFGTEVVGNDGTLDRRHLRKRVFSAPRERRRLERLLHPAIRAELEARASRAHGPYVLLVVPLLLEGGGYGWIDRVLVIDAPAELRTQRVARRDDANDTLVRAIMNAHMGSGERLTHADDVLINDTAIESLRGAVNDLHRNYLSRAAGARLRPTVGECDHR